MTHPATLDCETVIFQEADGGGCGIAVSTDDVVRTFGRRSRVPVVATIGTYTYRSSLMPMGGRHMLPVAAPVRTGAGVAAGDRVRVTLVEDLEPRTVAVPADLAAALDAAGMRAAFDAMPYTHRKEWVRALDDAKRPQTRAKRIADCTAAMHERASKAHPKPSPR